MLRSMQNGWEEYKNTLGTIISGILAARLTQKAPKESLDEHIVAIMTQLKNSNSLVPDCAVTRATIDYIQKNPEKVSSTHRQYADFFQYYEPILISLFEEKPELIHWSDQQEKDSQHLASNSDRISSNPASISSTRNHSSPSHC